MALPDKQIEIKEQVLISSKMLGMTKSSEGSPIAADRLPSNSPRFKDKRQPIFASKVPVNNENYEEIRKKMESDLEHLKKLQKKHQK